MTLEAMLDAVRRQFWNPKLTMHAPVQLPGLYLARVSNNKDCIWEGYGLTPDDAMEKLVVAAEQDLAERGLMQHQVEVSHA
jgi:hypothetical protein